MRLKKTTVSLLVSILLASLLLSFIPQTSLQEEEQIGTEMKLLEIVVAGTPHGPIDINGDDQFKSVAESESWPGNGSESDPYIIEDFDIDLGGTNGRCIYIRNTVSHFIIRDCTFTGASLSDGTGVNLWNVTNCEISENIFFDNYYSMSFLGDNGTVVNNEVLSSVSVGFYLSSQENSSISDNTIHGGQTGLILEGLQQCDINNNTITDSSQASMYLSYCEDLTVSDNDLIRGSVAGLYLYRTDNCTFNRIMISECGNGIFLTFSDDNSFTDCIIERNTNGILNDVFGAYGNVIELCEFRDNVERGIILDTGSKNLVKWNVFMNNSYGAVLCDSGDNIFDYNYYDYYSGPDVDGDKIGDFPITHPGSAGEKDLHPLILFPTYPEWESTPVNQNIEFGDELSYTLSVMPPIPVREWEISDIAHFMIDQTGTIRDIDVLDVGIYPIDVIVTNTYGLFLESSFTVTVSDSVSPVWISQIQDKTFNFGDDIEIQLMAWDLAGIDSWHISDSGNFSASSLSLVDTGILTITGLENLAVGTYALTITAYDSSGNYVTATLTVTVTPSGGGAGGTDFIVSSSGLVIGIVALIVGVFSLLSSRKSSE